IAQIKRPTYGDDRDRWEATANDGKELKPGHTGHVQIGNDHVGRNRSQLSESFQAVRGGENLVAFFAEQHGHNFAHAGFIIDKENRRSGFYAHSYCSVRRASTRLRTRLAYPQAFDWCTISLKELNI